jgi:hypothetical protein
MRWLAPEKQGILDPLRTEAAVLPQDNKPSQKAGRKPTKEVQNPDKNSSWKERFPVLMGGSLLGIAIAMHILDEQRPVLWNTVVAALAHSPKAVKVSLLEIWPMHLALIGAMLSVSIVAAGIWRGRKENVSKARKWAWALPVLALTEIFTHWVKAKTGNFHDPMPGFYSAPMMLVASMVLLYLLRKRPLILKEENAKPEVAAKAAGA